MLDNIIKEFEEKGIYITGISIDLLGLKSLIPNIHPNRIYPGNYEVFIHNGEINEINLCSSETKSPKTEFGGETIEASFLVPIAGFSNYFTSNEHSNLTNSERERSNFSRDKTIFKIILSSGISAILIALLINFLFFSSYYNELEQLRQDYQTELIRKSQIEKNKIALRKSRLIASSILGSKDSKVSFYLNRITSSAPKSVLFENYHFQPLIKTLKQGKELEIEDKVLIIQGRTKDKAGFSDWLKQLQAFSWISDLNIEDFRNTSGPNSFFKVKLKIEDE